MVKFRALLHTAQLVVRVRINYGTDKPSAVINPAVRRLALSERNLRIDGDYFAYFLSRKADFDNRLRFDYGNATRIRACCALR